MSTSATSLQYGTLGTDKSISKEKQTKDIDIGKEEIELILIQDK